MKFSKILVPVKGHAVDDQVIRLAYITARQYKAKVSVLHVIEMRRSLPLEAENAPEIQHAEEILEHVSQVAREAGYQVQTELLQARTVAPVLLEEAADRGSDLIILSLLGPNPRFGSRVGVLLLDEILLNGIENGVDSTINAFRATPAEVIVE